MPNFIIKLDDYYLEYSTIVDAPITYGLKRADFDNYYRREYGIAGLDTYEERMRRVDENGTSEIGATSVEETILCNRAGYDETKITKQEMINRYCKGGLV